MSSWDWDSDKIPWYFIAVLVVFVAVPCVVAGAWLGWISR
ncbi:hypothetical protein FF36_06411 [Frankia torreyi]|uniref:Uncharacterized protein n=1 Tax=Frankia torreyi TaxID=1856 RepID=A0A0D8B7H2_9ACTN|nr:hypothetical protein FF36_06411 [Frankia torreyi]KQM01734.1 hypothetical protein FF86_11171 [Frankia sp. CpI1-P]